MGEGLWRELESRKGLWRIKEVMEAMDIITCRGAAVQG